MTGCEGVQAALGMSRRGADEVAVRDDRHTLRDLHLDEAGGATLRPPVPEMMAPVLAAGLDGHGRWQLDLVTTDHEPTRFTVEVDADQLARAEHDDGVPCERGAHERDALLGRPERPRLLPTASGLRLLATVADREGDC
jgi:hypothetical protein